MSCIFICLGTLGKERKEEEERKWKEGREEYEQREWEEGRKKGKM